MKRHLVIVSALMMLAAVSAVAQMIRVPPFRTVAQLGPCGTGSPKIVAVTDALSVTDCSVGGGSADAMCMCRNGEWTPFGNAGSGTVTSVSLALSGLSWMVASGSPVTGAGGFVLSPASGQTPGLFLATCGSSTTVSLCTPTAAMIPALPYQPLATGSASSGTFYAWDGSWRTPPNGVTSATPPLNLSGEVLSVVGQVHTSLSADEHPQYSLLGGRSGGQSLIGGLGAGESLLLTSTANVSQGQVMIECPSYVDGCYGVGLFVDRTAGTFAGLQVRKAGSTQFTDVVARGLFGTVSGDPTVALAFSNALQVRADQKVCWNSDPSSLFGGASDLCVRRLSAGVLALDGPSGNGGTIQLGDAGVKPACDATARTRIWVDFGAAGVADTVEICVKDAADAYAWRTLI